MKNVLAISTGLLLLAVSVHASPVDLGTAADFGLLGGSGVSSAVVAGTLITGDVGSSATPAVTGFTEGMVHGNLYTTEDPATAKAQVDLAVAYNLAAGATPTMMLTGTNLNVYDGANPLAPGVYFFATSAQLTGKMMLDGGGDPNAQWIFQIGSTLTTAADSSVDLMGGATSDMVFWQVGSSATIGANNVFTGNIMALESITLNGGILNGRALARNGAVSITDSQVVKASASPVPEPSSIMALGTMLIPAFVLFKRKK